MKSNSVDETVTATDKDHVSPALSPIKQHSVSPSGQLDVDAVESDIEVSIYRHGHKQSADRSKGRRSQSLDDVRIEEMLDDTNISNSDKIYRDDSSTNGNGGDGTENFAASSEDVEAEVGNADDGHGDGVSDSSSQSIRIIPVVRAESFKEAMRSVDTQQPDYSRAFSQPAPAMTMTESARDSRSSWVMPVFPSLEEVFNEWFTSAMARTGSLGSSSGSPRVWTQSEASTSLGHGVQMRRESRNSSTGDQSPLNTPEFHNKRLTRLFDWEPTHLGPISGSSDSLNSSGTADDWINSRTELSSAARLPPGFETGLLDRGFGLRPSLFSRMPTSMSDSHFSRHLFNSASGNSALDAGKVVKPDSESRQLQSGSMSRVIPVKVISSRSSDDAASSGSIAGDSKVPADQQIVETKTAKDELDSVRVSQHKTVSLSKHSTQPTQPSSRLPTGFLTGFGSASIPNVSDTGRFSKVGGRPGADARNSKVAPVSETGDECRVRLIPITHERNAVTREASTRKERGTRSRVIPVVVQSSRDSSAANANATQSLDSQSSKTEPVSVPITFMQSVSGAASNVSAADSVSKPDRLPVSDSNYLPLCYDDGEEETVKKILQEMTVKRLPIRDTVRLLNTKTSRSRSMDFSESKRHGLCEEPPSSGNRNTTVCTPTADLLPAGFWVGDSTRTKPSESFAQGTQPVTGDLIRKRLHMFDAGDANL